MKTTATKKRVKETPAKLHADVKKIKNELRRVLEPTNNSGWPGDGRKHISNREKSELLKMCLKAICIHPSWLLGFIEKSLELHKKAFKNRKVTSETADCEYKLEILEAQVLKVFLED